MDFKLDKQHEMARQLFKDFAENEVKPLAQETDETEVFPRETVDKMMKLGFMGIAIPKEYGGQGCDPLMYTMCVEELAKVCGTTSVIVSAHSSLGADPIMMYGTEEQKKKYLPKAASGAVGAFALTEADAGSDAASARKISSPVSKSSSPVFSCAFTNSSSSESAACMPSRTRPDSVSFSSLSLPKIRNPNNLTAYRSPFS